MQNWDCRASDAETLHASSQPEQGDNFSDEPELKQVAEQLRTKGYFAATPDDEYLMSCLHEDITRRSGEGATSAWPKYYPEHEAKVNLCQSGTMWVVSNLEWPSSEDEIPAYLDVFELNMYEQVRMYGLDPEGKVRTSPKSTNLGEIGGLASGSLRRLGG